MSVDQASTFLGATILIGLGAIFLSVIIIIVNNLFAKFWEPIKWLNFIEYPPREPKLVEENPKSPVDK